MIYNDLVQKLEIPYTDDSDCSNTRCNAFASCLIVDCYKKFLFQSRSSLT